MHNLRSSKNTRTRSKRKRDKICVSTKRRKSVRSNKMKLFDLGANCGYNKYKIKELSEENGDCLFESIILSSDKFKGKQVSEFRKEISDIFVANRNEKYLDGTLEQIFTEFNDVPYYTYDDMVKDIALCGNWTLINTHLLLCIISKYYKLDFKIINNTSTKPICISTHDSDTLEEISLGHLLEYHYLPLKKME